MLQDDDDYRTRGYTLVRVRRRESAKEVCTDEYFIACDGIGIRITIPSHGFTGSESRREYQQTHYKETIVIHKWLFGALRTTMDK